MPETGLQQVFTLEQAAAYLGLTPKTLQKLAYQRKIAYTNSGRRMMFFESDIMAYLHSRRRPARRGGKR
jgi:excisionase family DNA binding protein